MEEAFTNNPQVPEVEEIKTHEKKSSLKIVLIVGILIVVAIIVVLVVLLAATDVIPIGRKYKHKYSYVAEIDGKNVTYYTANLIKENTTISKGEYSTTLMDESVFLVVDGALLTIEGEVKIKKTGENKASLFLRNLDDKPEPPPEGEEDLYSFYGINSAIVVLGKNSKAVIKGATITTNSKGANGIVATDQGEVEISESKIQTSQDQSRGLHATYKGKITADNVEISTEGVSCASLATDRGEGYVTGKKMTLKTKGAGSPLIYSTGEISVEESKGEATGAQICVVEGKNSAKIQNCEFSCTGKGNRGETDLAGVMVYQSFSGDAEEGIANFEATDSVLEVEESDVEKRVPFFFVTNTQAEISLTNTSMNFASNKLITAESTSEWGKMGENGADVDFIVRQEYLHGLAYADEFSTIIIEYDNQTVAVDFTTKGNVTMIPLE